MHSIPELEANCGSWIVTSPRGEVRELFEKADVIQVGLRGWRVETAAEYLGRVNAEIRTKSR